ncbi:MAG: CBS domain-containing protein [Anaerolineaceae bacterium]|nr:CBS domain-containing protein [Anaerolineaceae bacterium]
MDFTVRDWMNDLVVYIEPTNTVSEALALMRRRYIHSLIVKIGDDHSAYGIITSTDICDKIIARDQNPSEVIVAKIMTAPVLTINENEDIKDCAALMSKKQIHHIPVMNDKGNLVGMISASDFLVVAEAMGREPGEMIV